MIDDEPATAKANELMLTTESFNVYSSGSGEEGLDLGKLYDHDIILLDLDLLDMHRSRRDGTGSGSRTPIRASGIAPRKQAGQMAASDYRQIPDFTLASLGASTDGKRTSIQRTHLFGTLPTK